MRSYRALFVVRVLLQLSVGVMHAYRTVSVVRVLLELIVGVRHAYRALSIVRVLSLAAGLMHACRAVSVVRVLLELKTEIADGETTGPSTVYREKLRASSAVQVAPRKHFLLFATFLEATMIDKELKDKNIHFEMSLGTSARADVILLHMHAWC